MSMSSPSSCPFFIEKHYRSPYTILNKIGYLALMEPLSVYIIARNEADRLPRAIRSVQALADDIVVVEDGQSTDNTVAVAQALGARVFINPWPGYGPQKRFAEDQCRHDWVLCLDADEMITEAGAAEIGVVLAGPSADDFYNMDIVDVYPHATRPRLWPKPTRAIRLFRRSKGRTSSSAVHDRVDAPVGARLGRLRAPIWHYSLRSLDHLIKKYDAYTTLQAQTMKQKNKWILTVRLFTEYPMAFVQYYLFHRHCTGGMYGYVLSRLLAGARFQRIVKMWEK